MLLAGLLATIGAADPLRVKEGSPGREGVFVGCGFHGDQIELFHTWTATSLLRRVGETWVGAWGLTHRFEIGNTLRERLAFTYGPLRGPARLRADGCRDRIAKRYQRAGARYRVPAELIRGLGRCPEDEDPARVPWGSRAPVACLELTQPIEFQVWGPDDVPRPVFGSRIPLLAAGEHAKIPGSFVAP